MRARWSMVAAGLIACGGPDPVTPKQDAPGDAGTPDAPPVDEGPRASRTFTRSGESFLEPERGWMDGSGLALVDSTEYAAIRAAGYTLAYANPRLDAFRSSAIDAPWLTKLDAGLARVRAAGIKVVLRFVYNASSTGEDAPQARVIEHVGQLGPVIARNADVIAVVQAGLIGKWGEWHGSTNGLDVPAARKAILEALLSAVPPSRMVQVRTPMFKAALFPQPLADARAFDGSAQARVGHHDDCFLASDSDQGTYETPVERWKQYVEADSRFVAVGGETCKVNPPRSECGAALAEMARHHWSFLNDKYEPAVIARFKALGCAGEIGRRLGHRFVLRDASWNASVKPGGVLSLQLTVENEGWAAPYNPRRLHVVLDDGARKRVAATSIDPRWWAPGRASSLTIRLRVPVDAAPGSYRVALWLPDEAPALRDRPEYALRFANEGTWDARSGESTLTDALRVDTAAPGSADASARDFSVVP